MGDWSVYLISNEGCTYVGMTNDVTRRIRRHNGVLSGGAVYTTSKGPGWKYELIISGFGDKVSACQFEWAVKHEQPIKAHGMQNRLLKFARVLNKPQWTSKSRLASSYDLEIRIFGDPGNFLTFREALPEQQSVSILEEF